MEASRAVHVAKQVGEAKENHGGLGSDFVRVTLGVGDAHQMQARRAAAPGHWRRPVRRW